MEFGRAARGFQALGYGLAALAVDPPERSSALRRSLRLPFPLLCDAERAAVAAWGVFSQREKGGIAEPATVVVSAEGRLLWFERERMTSRVRAADLLAFLRDPQAAPPKARSFCPGLASWFRALGNGLRHGLRSPRSSG